MNPRCATLIAERPAPLPLPPGPYELRIAGLRARWPDGELVAFGDADLVLPPGRRVALVGCGRFGFAVLAAVLLRLIDYEGSVTLGGVELRDLSGEDVRAVIGACARDTRIEHVTIAANVRSARPAASDAQVADAMRRAGLGDPPGGAVDDSLPGEVRQRVALARALLADLPVLIVDRTGDSPEGAPADDPAGDRVLAELLDAAGDRTLLLVSRHGAVPGGTPLLRQVDEVVSLSGR